VKHWISLPLVLDQSLGNTGVKEMIVVMPNAYTRFAGSMYSSSATIGDWETFVAKELVAYVDQRYRTMPAAANRGLAGHSMGGYGTLRIGMKHPETFSALYALSPCCLTPDFRQPMSAERWSKISGVQSYEELAKADFMVKAMYASAAAWSPNPEKPPFFVDFPWANGEVQRPVADKWNANAPLVFVDQYVDALRGMRGLALDAGDKDGSITATVKTMHSVLERYKVAHFSEIYEGDHLNRIANRIETKVMPFFSERLAFQ
jgi:enterochelin esterase-like enzyme